MGVISLRADTETREGLVQSVGVRHEFAQTGMGGLGGVGRGHGHHCCWRGHYGNNVMCVNGMGEEMEVTE